MEFLLSFLRRHFEGKQVMASRISAVFSGCATQRKEQQTHTKYTSFLFFLPVLETLYALKEKMASLLQQSTFLWLSRLSIVP